MRCTGECIERACQGLSWNSWLHPDLQIWEVNYSKLFKQVIRLFNGKTGNQAPFKGYGGMRLQGRIL